MKVEVLRLAIDFGLVILIWMVQLLIYPSFEYFAGDGLARWHRIYARNITFIVAPLMIIQVAIAAYFWMYYSGMFAPNLIYTILVAATWISTMVIFIPMHQAIDKHPHDKKLCQRLTRSNWIRVFLWSVILILDLYLIY